MTNPDQAPNPNTVSPELGEVLGKMAARTDLIIDPASPLIVSIRQQFGEQPPLSDTDSK